MVLHVQDANRLYSSAVTATDLHHGHDGYHHDWDGVNGTHNGTFWGHYHHHGHGCRFFMLSVLFFSIAIFLTFKLAKRQKFASPLHGCFDDWATCLTTCLLPCLTFGRNAEYALRIPGALGCMVYCCCNKFACCLGLVSRNGLRKRMNIDGTLSQDVAVHCFAHPCALCQEAREIQARGADIEQPMTVVNAVVPNSPVTYVVTRPAGTAVGQMLAIQTPSGMVEVAVPEGVAEGASFHIQIAAPVLKAAVVEPMKMSERNTTPLLNKTEE